MFPSRKEVVVIALHPPGQLIANKSLKKLALQSSVTIFLLFGGGGRTSGIIPARSGGSGPGIFNWLALLQGFPQKPTRNSMYAISGNFLHFMSPPHVKETSIKPFIWHNFPADLSYQGPGSERVLGWLGRLMAFLNWPALLSPSKHICVKYI